MQITLNQQEIEKAIINYVGNQGIAITGKHVSVSLSAGRGENRMSATIDISNDEVPPTKAIGCCTPTVTAPTVDKAQLDLPFARDEEPSTSDDTRPEEPAERPLFGS